MTKARVSMVIVLLPLKSCTFREPWANFQGKLRGGQDKGEWHEERKWMEGIELSWIADIFATTSFPADPLMENNVEQWRWRDDDRRMGRNRWVRVTICFCCTLLFLFAGAFATFEDQRERGDVYTCTKTFGYLPSPPLHTRNPPLFLSILVWGDVSQIHTHIIFSHSCILLWSWFALF